MTPVETCQLDLHVVCVQACDNDSLVLGLKEELDRKPFAEATEGRECSNNDICHRRNKSRLNDLLGNKVQELCAVGAEVRHHFLQQKM